MAVMFKDIARPRVSSGSLQKPRGDEAEFIACDGRDRQAISAGQYTHLFKRGFGLEIA
jgi:hypothetical protein